MAADINADGDLDSNTQTASVAVTGEMLNGDDFEGADNVDLFLAGKKLQDLLKQLKAQGLI